MDMPISQINNRLFARLPPDPGIGLLFAVGTVSQLVFASGDRPIQFTLRHSGYALRCKVAPCVRLTTKLKEGQEIRATGHLSFSTQSAQFHLLVRDLEVLLDNPLQAEISPQEIPSATDRKIVPDWLAKVQRRAQANPAQLAQADVPDWVQALAPAGEPKPTDPLPTANTDWGEQRVEQILGKLEPVTPEGSGEPELVQDEQLMAFLLEALDRSEHEDIELTPELMAQFTHSPHLEETAPAREQETPEPDFFDQSNLAPAKMPPLVVIAILFALGAIIISGAILLAQAGFF